MELGNTAKSARLLGVLGVLLTMIPIVPASVGQPVILRCECAWEFPEMLPPEFLDRMTGIQVAFTPSLTIERVHHPTHGAPIDTPWTVHVDRLNVHAKPTLMAPILGALETGNQISGQFNLIVESDEEWLQIDVHGLPGHAPMMGLHRVHPRNRQQLDLFTNLPIGEEIVNRWWGIPLEYEPDDLVALPLGYTAEQPGREYLLRKEAATMVMALIDAAREDGLDMRVSSPYRSGQYQQQIYGNAVARRGLSQRASAPPGHSEHQLGTTVDFSNPNTRRFLNNSDPRHAWLRENGHRFGFRQTYTADNRHETGYIEEPWHWRYMGAPSVTKEQDWLFF